MTTQATKLRNAAKTTGLDRIVELLNQAADALEVQSAEIQRLRSLVDLNDTSSAIGMCQASLSFELMHLIDKARASGHVITVTTVPLQPLRMGNHMMLGDVRRARVAR